MIWSICLKHCFHCPREEKLPRRASSLLCNEHMYCVPSILTIPVKERECISRGLKLTYLLLTVTVTAELPSALGAAIQDQSLMSGSKTYQYFLWLLLKSWRNFPSSLLKCLLLDELSPWPVTYFCGSYFCLSRKWSYFYKTNFKDSPNMKILQDTWSRMWAYRKKNGANILHFIWTMFKIFQIKHDIAQDKGGDI